MLPTHDNRRIAKTRPLLPPAILIEELPLSDTASDRVDEHRVTIAEILTGKDPRLMVIAGPCSIHDPGSALKVADRLHALSEKFSSELFVVMRVYFEKPRTTVGWKGLINDPKLDGSFEINQGLREARTLLAELCERGLPAGTEFLDTIIPQFIADAISWAAIGARTTESQVHRELASGLSMPVGFKNGTSGNVQIAVDAVTSARQPHWFPSVTKQGVAAIFQTVGNESAHVILRGGSRTGPNYDAKSIQNVLTKLEKQQLPPYVVVDCSHGNSNKDYTRQAVVAKDLAGQIADGQRGIAGIMLESHLVAGRQDYRPDGPNVHGQSITDGCIDLDETERICETLANAVHTARRP